MKKIFKNFISITIALILILSVFSFSTSAAKTIIAFSKNSVTVGENLVVTVSITGDEAMYAVGCRIEYDPAVFEYVSGASAGGAGILNITESPSGDSKVSYNITFKALKAGTSTFAVNDCQYEGLTDSISVLGASATATVTDVSLSGNANLSALSLSAGTLSPKFSASKTSYSVNVKNSVSDIAVYATAADSGASVNAPANTKLEIGKNTISVVVTAANGTQKTYTINVYRSESEEITNSVPETNEEPGEANPLETLIDGVSYTVATDISGVTLLNGFTATTAQFNGTDVAAAIDDAGKLTVYYLTAAGSETPTPFTLDEGTNTFKPLQYYLSGNNVYIFSETPFDFELPEKYYKTNTNIAGFEVECFKDIENSDLFDFYYVYCYSQGDYGIYRYDSIENTIQRFPEFDSSISAVSPDFDTEKSDNFLSKFKKLSTNAKIIVITLALVLVGAVVLIILLIIKFVKRRDEEYFPEPLEFDDDFSTITFDDDEDALEPIYDEDDE